MKTRILAILVLITFVTNCSAQTFLNRIVAGSQQMFELPVYATAPVDDFNRLYVPELRSGKIKILDLNTNTALPTPFIQIPNLGTQNEQGLLGMAFDPNYSSNGYFYVNYVDTNHVTRIERYTASGNPLTATTADPQSRHSVISIQQPFQIHNAGWIGFSPNDGFLYIPTGDGGDPDRSQDLNDLGGKVLRIDVHGDDFASEDSNYSVPQDNPFGDEIWAYGLRNPFRSSFDRETGDFWIGDVGKADREEINWQLSSSAGGENYGWKLREGTIETPGFGGPRPADNVEPTYDYQHDDGDPDFRGSTVIGGYVYHGSAPEFKGQYLFADFISGNIWSLDDGVVTNINSELQPNFGGFSGGVSFAEDGSGEVYIIELGGGDIFRIESNTIGFSPGDFNEDGFVNGTDLDVWEEEYGVRDGEDFLTWQRGLSNGVVSTPEPESAILLAICIALLLNNYREHYDK